MTLATRALPFALRLPVVAAPMFLISGPELVLAACKAGIIGAFPTPNARPVSVLADWMHQITEGLAQARDVQPAATIGPWCANLVTHSSNTRLAEDLALVARFKPPVVVTALGSPKPAIEVVHAYGGLVIADVISVGLAKKAVAAGADGLACVCAGAGGHTGALTPFAFVAAVREFFEETNIPPEAYTLHETLRFTETFKGTNNIMYRHIYFVAMLKDSKIVNLKQKLTFMQSKEISEVDWKSLNECKSVIRPHYTERLNLMGQVERLIATHQSL
jgi:8-oxo-dGTP pyrophosphatase MutT (NUDIX family)